MGGGPNEKTRVTASVGPSRDLPTLRTGARLGRYTVLERLGAGAMGVVHAALDRELDRRVALKVLYPSKSSAGRPSLLDEAKAMAQVSDPHVATVFDAGSSAGPDAGSGAGSGADMLFIAMELVRGGSLMEWLDERREWTAVLAMFIQAGRGLHAAHEAGLVHGDFKPHNVLVDIDGSAKVTDFGLCRQVFEEPVTDVGTHSRDSSVVVASGSAVPGTPAYMSPEMYAGRMPTTRSDQFAFCVALYEALYGFHPFMGHERSRTRLVLGVTTGRVLPPPAGSVVPGWVHAAVAKGLARDPRRRHASMEGLLHRLERGGRFDRRRATWALATIGLAAAPFAVAHVHDHYARAACRAEADAPIEPHWGDARRAALAAAYDAAGLGPQDEALAYVTRRLDAYAGDWADASAEVCEAELDGLARRTTQARTDCLDESRMHLAARLDVLETYGWDRTILIQAPAALVSLPPPRACTQVGPPEGPRMGEARADVIWSLARSWALSATGRTDEALTMLDETVHLARAAGDDVALGRARAARGRVLTSLNRAQEAREDLEAAYFDLVARGRFDHAFMAAVDLVAVTGFTQRNAAEGERWIGHARAAADLSDDVDDLDLASLYLKIGLLERAQGDAAAARDAYAEALQRQQSVLGPDHPKLATAHNNLGSLAAEDERFDEARRHFKLSLRIRRAALGPSHPDTAGSMLNLANLWAMEHQREKAAAAYEKVEDVLRRRAVREYPLAVALTNHAAIERDLGRPERAEALAREALGRLGERALPMVPIGYVRQILGGALVDLGRRREAEPLLRQALRELTEGDGPKAPRTLHTRYELGRLLAREGRYEEARAQLQSVIDSEAVAATPTVGLARLELATLDESQGHPARALEHLRYAAKTLEAAGGSTTAVNRAHATIARIEGAAS